VRDFCAEDLGWRVYPFLQPVIIDGITFQHYPDKGGKAPGDSTKHLAANGLAFMHKSCVFFHTHRFDYFEEPRGESRIACTYAGCYFEHWEDWAGSSNLRWRRGIVTATDVKEGVYSPHFHSMDEIKAKYGG
jgi:hypothetical protein